MSSTNISVAIATSTTPLRLFAHCKLTQKTTLGLLFAQHHSLLNNSNGIHCYPELAYYYAIPPWVVSSPQANWSAAFVRQGSSASVMAAL